MPPKLIIDNMRADFQRSHEPHKSNVAEAIAGGSGGGHMGGMNIEERVGKIEVEVGTIRGGLDWAKIAVGILTTIVIGGFGILIAQMRDVSSQVGNVTSKIEAEFRAQRQEQSAQVNAISNAITASKQQPPQVLLVPAPQVGTQKP